MRVEGQLAVNSGALAVKAAIAGAGLAFVLEDRVRDDLEAGRLTRVLADWCPPFSGFHLYYPSRRHQTPAFAIVVDSLRYRG
ncbi:DNA-binding transcriptional LysR family regulator [Rhizobium sp. BK379]|nr:DNA-binding transcriptional LysR family regulator [Rhizobium sp. BK379]